MQLLSVVISRFLLS